MNTSDRREDILNKLRQSSEPIPAKDFAQMYKVSRQVIVQDLAVIRASTEGILATNRGYILQADNICQREYKVMHGLDRTAEELNLIVDCGGTIKNVSISHRVYNRVTANMNIGSRHDVSEFMNRIVASKSSLLGNATSGYHYHLVEAPSEDRLDLIEKKLDEAGFLVPWLQWEKEQQRN